MTDFDALARLTRDQLKAKYEAEWQKFGGLRTPALDGLASVSRKRIAAEGELADICDLLAELERRRDRVANEIAALNRRERDLWMRHYAEGSDDRPE